MKMKKVKVSYVSNADQVLGFLKNMEKIELNERSSLVEIEEALLNIPKVGGAKDAYKRLEGDSLPDKARDLQDHLKHKEVIVEVGKYVITGNARCIDRAVDMYKKRIKKGTA